MRPALTPEPAGRPRSKPRQGATHPTTHTTTEGDLMSTTPSAGGILAAADALRGPQQTYTREQVAYLLRLAYDSGRTATYLDDLAQWHCTWADRPFLRRTYEQRVADETADMAARAARQPWNTLRGQHPGGPVDWETGRPIRNQLRSVA